MKMVMFMKEIGLMIKLMGLVYIKINQDLDMKVTGKMIFKKVKELKLGQMALLI